MPSINKVLAGIATVGTMGGAGAGGYYAFSNSNSVSKQLIAEGFTLIKTTEEWTNLLSKYKNANKDIFTGDKNNIDLRSKCETILNQTPNNSNYKLARKWCVKEEGIDKILKNSGYTILDSTKEVANENVFWKQKVDLLKPNPFKFESVKDKIKDPETQNGENIKALKAACKELEVSSTLTTADKFNENFDLAREFCAIKN